MPADTPLEMAISALSEREIDALVSGAVWYVRYHQRDIPSEDEDRSAAAVARREHFENLFAALEKLGVRVRRPAAINGR